MAPIPITVAADGTFRATVMAEAGTAVIAAAWLNFGSTWGDTTITLTTLDPGGKVLSRRDSVQVRNNTTGSIEIPAGCAMATVEGRVSAPGTTIPAAALVSKVR